MLSTLAVTWSSTIERKQISEWHSQPVGAFDRCSTAARRALLGEVGRVVSNGSRTKHQTYSDAGLAGSIKVQLTYTMNNASSTCDLSLIVTIVCPPILISISVLLRTVEQTK